MNEDFTPKLMGDVLGLEWADITVRNHLQKIPNFNNWEYTNRSYFFYLKVYEIKRYYPEYITNVSKRVIDFSAGNGILLEIMRWLGHEVVGTDIPGSVFSMLARTQGIPIIEHNCNILPFPVPSDSYDLLVNVGAIHHYISPWKEVLDEFFRIARETVFISVTRGDNYDNKKHILDEYDHVGWVKVPDLPIGIYKWVKV